MVPTLMMSAPIKTLGNFKFQQVILIAKVKIFVSMECAFKPLFLLF